MARIAAIHSSAAGTTAGLAEAVRAGAGEAAEAASRRTTGADIAVGRFENGNFCGSPTPRTASPSARRPA